MLFKNKQNKLPGNFMVILAGLHEHLPRELLNISARQSPPT